MQSGNPADAVYAELVEPVAEQMMRIAQRITHGNDEAADAFQQAIVQIWMRLPEILAHPNPKGYLLRTASSAAYDVLRRRSRHQRREEAFASALPDNALGAEKIAEQHWGGERIGAAIAELSRSQAEAVTLRLIADQSFETIGEALSCTPETARSHYSKGRARLRRILEKGEDEATEDQKGLSARSHSQ